MYPTNRNIFLLCYKFECFINKITFFKILFFSYTIHLNQALPSSQDPLLLCFPSEKSRAHKCEHNFK